MGRSRFIAVADIRLGAIYRFSLRRKLSRASIRGLLQTKMGWNEKRADQLVGHWLSSEPFRRAAETEGRT